MCAHVRAHELCNYVGHVYVCVCVCACVCEKGENIPQSTNTHTYMHLCTADGEVLWNAVKWDNEFRHCPISSFFMPT